jgi:hypothetical protein
MGGRTKGTPNKTTAQIKDWVVALIGRNTEQIEEDLLAMEPKDRVMMFERLMRYVLPTQTTIEQTGSETESMSREDIMAEIERLQRNRMK